MILDANESPALCSKLVGSGLLGLFLNWLCEELQVAGDAVSACAWIRVRRKLQLHAGAYMLAPAEAAAPRHRVLTRSLCMRRA